MPCCITSVSRSAVAGCLVFLGLELIEIIRAYTQVQCVRLDILFVSEHSDCSNSETEPESEPLQAVSEPTPCIR